MQMSPASFTLIRAPGGLAVRRRAASASASHTTEIPFIEPENTRRKCDMGTVAQALEELLKAVIIGKCSSVLFKAGHLSSRQKCGILLPGLELKSNQEERNNSSVIHTNL